MTHPVVLATDRLKEVAAEIYELQLADDYASCLTCKHFTEATELCGLCGQRPPARVLVHACDQWVDFETSQPMQDNLCRKVEPAKTTAPQNDGFGDLDDDIPF